MVRIPIASIFKRRSQTPHGREGVIRSERPSSDDDVSWDRNEEAEDVEEPEDQGLTAEEAAMRREMAPIIAARNQQSSPLLRLPAELRNQIYGYLDLGGHTIEVLLASSKAARTKQRTTVSDQERLFFRIVVDRDSRAKTQRYMSLGRLFPLLHVCQQLRQDTSLLFYQRNTFAFTDIGHNYAKALKPWLASLTMQEKAAVPAISWPLRQAQEYRRLLNGRQMENPDRDCSADLAQLSSLRKVTLRWVGTDINTKTLSREEQDQLERIFDSRGGWDYRVEREFHRRLAVNAMRKQISRDDVEIGCEGLSLRGLVVA